jgi:xanthine dehydrogenase YagT iron-sulfur-binding subunit
VAPIHYHHHLKVWDAAPLGSIRGVFLAAPESFSPGAAAAHCSRNGSPERDCRRIGEGEAVSHKDEKLPKSRRPASPKGVDRRVFLKTVGVGTGAVTAGLLQPPQAQGAAGGKVVGPGPIPVTLNVDGRKHRLELEPRVTLLDAVRDRLKITGNKRVCDRATCGACTMLMDGKAVYACTVLAVEAEGHRITTIEGLQPANGLHPLSAAFVEHDGQQCGFCTPGFVVAAKAFLDEHPAATLQQVRAGLGGNLCRCGTYHGITEAALEIAAKGAARA